MYGTVLVVVVVDYHPALSRPFLCVTPPLLLALPLHHFTPSVTVRRREDCYLAVCIAALVICAVDDDSSSQQSYIAHLDGWRKEEGYTRLTITPLTDDDRFIYQQQQ